ncbi:hypothetical protein [Ensifer aridi]|uniref:hypothetical protein n=1 Tax=Ensifer aridi TaxID=1708715 RepID=UPI00047BAB49|nr:hypothetical protein [Ensifer aridi]
MGAPAKVHPLEPKGISKFSSQPDHPVLQAASRSHQLEKYGWPETIILNVPLAGVALFLRAQEIDGIVPIYLVNAIGAKLKSVFVSDAGFIDFDETHEDTLPHVCALESVENGTGVFLDAYNLDLARDFLVSYTVIATTEQGIRYSGTAHVLEPPRDDWCPVEDWAPISA